MILAIAAFFVAALLALYATPIARTAALRFGIVDRPDGCLKQQAEPVPYLGGIAVFTAFLITLGITADFTHGVLGILLGGTLMLLLGLIDDLGALSPGQKLAGQLIAVIVLMKAGLYVELTFLPMELALAISILWLLTIINAWNIIDIMDGLASGVGAVAAIFLSVVGVWNGRPSVAVMAAALAGSLIGFLRFNWRPAKIYLGDSGSLFIGLTLGALAMNCAYTDRNWVAMATPVVLLGVPLFDLLFVIVVRLEKGLSPFRGSPDHVALRLRRAGLSVPQVVGLATGIGLALGLVGLWLIRLPSPWPAAMLLGSLAVVAVAASFGLRATGEVR